MSDENNQNAAPNQTAAQANNRPADTLRDGSLKATIWERQGDKGVFHTTTLSRTYSDREGNPRDGHSFGPGDLLRVSELAKRAYHRTQELRRDRTSAEEDRAPGEQGERKADFKASRRNSRARTRRRDDRS